MKKEGVLVLGILISLGLVFAAHTITLPSSSSINETLVYTHNISVQNTDVGVATNISEVNITLWGDFNFLANTNATDGATNTFSNTSTVLSWNGDGLVMNSTTKYFWFNATALIPGTYNITVTTLNVTGSFETNISITVNDTTVPSAISFVAPGVLLNNNYSATSLPINISVTDEGTVDRINITLYNSTSDLINSSMSASGNSSYYYNFTGLSEGTYYVNATVNDTANNINYSVTSQVVLDTTAPVIALDCGSEDAYVGGTLTCTCTATDTGGVGGTGVTSPTFVTSLSTDSAGDFVANCNATDSAGNLGTKNLNYVIRSVSGSGTTGGSGTTYAYTYAFDNQEFSELGQASKQIKKNERIRIKFGGVKHNIGITALTSTSVDIEVYSTIQKATLNINDEKMFDLDDDDNYDLKVILNSIESNEANLTLEYINITITPANEEQGVVQEEQVAGDVTGDEAGVEESEGEGDLRWFGIVIAIIIAIGIVVYFFKDNLQEILQKKE